MLDVRPIAFVAPIDEQVLDDILPAVSVKSLVDEGGYVTGRVAVYRQSLGVKLYESVLHPATIAAGETITMTAETIFSPGAVVDDDYFIMCYISAINTHSGHTCSNVLGPYTFDIKPGPMGPAPAAHHTTHENGGIDEISVTGLSGLLADPQDPTAHHLTHQLGGSDPIDVTGLPGSASGNVEDLPTAETDPSLVLAPDGAGGVEFRAEAGGGSGLSELPQVLDDGANIAWDLSLGGVATVTLAGNRTLNEASNMVDGMHASLRIIQDGTGTRLITWHASYRFPGAVKPALSAAPNNIDILLFTCDGTHMDCVGMVSAVA